MHFKHFNRWFPRAHIYIVSGYLVYIWLAATLNCAPAKLLLAFLLAANIFFRSYYLLFRLLKCGFSVREVLAHSFALIAHNRLTWLWLWYILALACIRDEDIQC